jgi:type IV pilus assembly protein PilC
MANASTQAKAPSSSPARKVSSSGPSGKAPKAVKRIPKRDETITLFTRQMATLLSAGLPILKALETLRRQEKQPAFQSVLDGLAENIRSGGTFSDGLRQYPGIFDHLYLSMVRAGEAGGLLTTVLERLSGFMEKSRRTRQKVKAALMYPIIVLIVAAVIVGLLMVFVVPKFKGIFNEMLKGAPLPGLTQFVIGVSDFMQNHFILFISGVVVVFFGVKFARRTPAGAHLFDWLALKLPKFGDLTTKVAVSRFARTLGSLLSSGVPILEALRITRDVVGNSIISKALGQVHDRVRDGETIATPLAQANVFPDMLCSMVEVGEETAALDAMLNRIADTYDEDVDNAVAGLTSMIEPLMISFLAVVVGTIVIALFLPIIGIIENLSA